MDNKASQKEPERKNSAAARERAEVAATSSISKLFHFFPEWLRGRIAPAFGTLVALLGFWFSPLKDIVFHKIWRESAMVELHLSTDRVGEGDEFKVTVVVTPRRIDVSAGTIVVDYSSDMLQLRGPGKVISVPGTKEVTVASTLTFRALKHGPALAHISLRTKYGFYEADRRFMILNLADQTHPSKFNLSGSWNLRLDQSNGELHLIDRDGAISGSYELESGDIGSIRGVRGPAAFQVSLSSSKKHQRYSVECIVNLQDEYLELKGDAKPEPKLQTDRISFYASSRT